MAGKNRVFKFDVTRTPPTNAGSATAASGPNGSPQFQFSYAPTDDWTYGATDTLHFETDAGPFTLDLIRKDAIDDPTSMRPFPPLASQPQGSKHVATTKINSGLTAPQRDALIAAHQTAANPIGFIARYRYKIAVD